MYLYFLYAEDNLFQILKTEISGSLTAVNISLSTLFIQITLFAVDFCIFFAYLGL